MQEVNVTKATGHGNIPNKILKIAAPVISISLAGLFNLSITTNTFPDDWKVAKVFRYLNQVNVMIQITLDDFCLTNYSQSF